MCLPITRTHSYVCVLRQYKIVKSNLTLERVGQRGVALHHSRLQRLLSRLFSISKSTSLGVCSSQNPQNSCVIVAPGTRRLRAFSQSNSLTSVSQRTIGRCSQQPRQIAKPSHTFWRNFNRPRPFRHW